MRRRKFLKVAGVGTALAAIGFWGIRSFHSSVKTLILQDTRGLNLKEEEIDKFLGDSEREMFWKQYDFTKKGFILAHTWLGSSYLPYKFKYSQYRNKIVGTFLLSTNYFSYKMDSDKAIQYVAFYNPYKKPCGSPFSNLYYPQSV